jgi:hypothetical protein
MHLIHGEEKKIQGMIAKSGNGIFVIAGQEDKERFRASVERIQEIKAAE